MSKIYIPTTTLNFNNIFSTESISPASFYNSRNYGYKRFEKVEPNLLDDYIIAFDKFPIFETDSEELDHYPLVIEIDTSLIKGNFSEVSSQEGIKIYAIQETIYLNPSSVRFFFFNDDHKKICLIKAEPSIETKQLPIYSSKFISLNSANNALSSLERFPWKMDKSFSIDPSIKNDISVLVEKDRQIDRAKGFYYGYIIGVLLSTESSRRYIIDALTEINDEAGASLISQTKQEVRSNILQLKRFVEDSFDLNSLEIDTFFEAIFVDLFKDKNELETIIKLVNVNDSNTVHDILMREFTPHPSKILGLFDDLVNCFEKTYESTRADIIKRQLIGVIRKLRYRFTISSDIENVIYFNGSTLTAIEDPFFNTQASVSQYLFKDIINHLIRNKDIVGTESFKQNRFDSTVEIGKLVLEHLPSNEPIRSYINKFLGHLDSYQPFDVREFDDIGIQSLILFLQKGEDPEKLIQTSKDNGLYDFRLVMGLWGAMFGFSALPKTLTRKLIRQSASGHAGSSFTRFYQDVHSKLHENSVQGPIQLVDIDVTKKKDQRVGDLPSNDNSSTEQKAKEAVVDKNAAEKSSRTIQQPPNCPKCGSLMIERRGPANRPFWGCSKYPNCTGTRDLKTLEPWDYKTQQAGHDLMPANLDAERIKIITEYLKTHQNPVAITEMKSHVGSRTNGFFETNAEIKGFIQERMPEVVIGKLGRKDVISIK